MSSSTEVQEELVATEEQLRSAEREFDSLLVTGSESDIAKAEANLERLRRAQARLERQRVVLAQKEAAERAASAAEARQAAEEALARCNRDLADAFENFFPAFRERVAELHAFALEELAAPLSALDAARAHVDQLHGRVRPFIPKSAVIDGYTADEDMLTQRMRVRFVDLGVLTHHTREFGLLGFIEHFVRTVEGDAPRSAA
jgi:hypothetical protein